MQVTLELWLSAVSGAASLLVAGYAWRFRDRRAARTLTAFALASAIWAAGNAAQSAATTLPLKLFAVNVQYVGIVLAPVAWVAFAATYTGYDDWLTRRTYAVLAVVPAVTLALVWTGDPYALVRTSARLVTRDGVVRLARTFGPWFWIVWVYSGVLNGLGTILLLRALVRARDVFRKQTLAILVGVTVPAAAQMAYYTGMSPFEPESFVGVTAVAFGYALTRYRLFDLVPIARDQLVEELDDGVLVVDATGRVVDANPAVERMLDVSDVVGRDLDDVLPDQVNDARQADDGDPVSVRDETGEDRWLAVHSVGLDETPGHLVRLRDVTALERHRRELERENERLERVTDTISHDIRSPLTVASGSLELARETGEAENFERAERALERAERIVESTLRAARTDLGTPNRERVALADVARNAWETVNTGGMALEVPDEGAVVADSAQLQSLFENLFRNAREHGNATRVVVERTDEGFSVADDGTGIGPADREHVFEHGYSTSTGGTGFGLGIVRAVADAHGWTVSVSASASGGARFDFTVDPTASRERAVGSTGEPAE